LFERVNTENTSNSFLITTSDDVKEVLTRVEPAISTRSLGNQSGQIGAFVVGIKKGDWIVLPRKTTAALAVGEVKGDHVYEKNAPEPYRHSRAVEWKNTDVPRTVIDKDLLFSLGSLLTICKISRNDAENRFKQLAKEGWKSPSVIKSRNAAAIDTEIEPEDEQVDLEQLARDEIAKLIKAKFTGHGLARLVEGVLRAQGYTTHRSPEGPDKGVDLLAAPGPLGFDKPRICVQVKSGDDPVDSPILNQLIGSMQNVHADQGLLVSWGGFRQSVTREVPVQFFRVRMWDQVELLTQIFTHYDRLDEDLRAELPLKRIWTVAAE
jgi:restriction system protein